MHSARSRVLAGVLTVVVAMVLTACDSGEDDEAKVSRSGTSESHNAGKNCMTCHSPGGSGEYVFSVAGTVYKPDLVSVHPGSVIRFHSAVDGGGNLVASIEVDDKGNFYTTEPVNLTAGPFASAEGTAATRYMQTSLSAGACNGCHGVTTSVISVE